MHKMVADIMRSKQQRSAPTEMVIPGRTDRRLRAAIRIRFLHVFHEQPVPRKVTGHDKRGKVTAKHRPREKQCQANDSKVEHRLPTVFPGAFKHFAAGSKVFARMILQKKPSINVSQGGNISCEDTKHASDNPKRCQKKIPQ